MINKLQLLGRMGQDPDASVTKTGSPVVHFSIATSRSWKQKETGERITETTWHRLVCFGKLAEIIQKHGKKGMLVFVEGRLKNDEWNDKTTGEKRRGISIVGSAFQIIDWNNAVDNAKDTSNETLPPEPRDAPGPREEPDDEIPF